MLRSIAVERRRAPVAIVTTVTVALLLILPNRALAEAGRVHEFRVPVAGSHPGGITIGPDGAVWFTQIATSAIGRLDVRTRAITSFPMPHGGQPTAIVSGPDGALWFTEYSGDRIGRISTSGQITEFPVAGGGPWDITVGPDGALWFTEEDGNRIGRITTGGAITRFDLPYQDHGPIGIANGPDGALWFTNANGVARITTGGSVTHKWTGTSGNGITTGPDGNVWFVEAASDAVGRLNPSTGRIRHLPIDLGCFPQEIESGSGALWFTCYFLDEVGRVTMDGQVTPFPVPNHFGGTYPNTLEGIAPGAGHAMWFTEEAANRIGRISTS